MKIKTLNDIRSVASYLTRIGAEARSLKTAVVREQSGRYWKDLAVIRIARTGEVDVSSAQYKPTDLEQASIIAEIATVEWPNIKPIDRLIKPPQMIADASVDNIFEFRNEAGKIIFVQVRVNAKEGKAYVPWTYWDDDEWRCCEPDGPLPLYNVDKIGDNATVFIHEGAKAAKYVQWMVEGKTVQAREALKNHPWGRELSGAAHIGWIGGALSPYRTDWSALARAGVKRVYIVADNDEPGRAAVPAISQQLRLPTFTIQFTDEFPASFDLFDKFPEKMFGKEGRVYIGPAFRDCLHPATWATDILPPVPPATKGVAVLRDSFKGMWSYIEEADLFVCTEMPDIIRPEPILNKMLAPFSHVAETARLIVKAYTGRQARVCYRPDEKGLTVTFRGSSAINLHVPPTIVGHPGDPRPFLEFLEYLFVNEQERKNVERWCATLIARPEVRMAYGLLLISETQGVGKTTLGALILAPLVGTNNVSYPSEQDIGAPFNDWVANKRLAVVGEIYSGSSWKAYNALKAIITDKDVTVNQKYQRQYTIENWCHVLACSNSMRALKMENDDRRWFYPEVVEVPWPQKKFDEFRSWLESGGLNIIKAWADAYGDYVRPSERAPMTERKREMIEGSRSEAQKEAVAIAEVMKDSEQPMAVVIKDVHAWCKAAGGGRIFDTDYELRRAMIEAGLSMFPKRIKVGGRLQYALMNNPMRDAVQRATDATEAAALIRKSVIQISSFMQSEI